MDCQVRLDDHITNMGMSLGWCLDVYVDSLASSQSSVSFAVARMSSTSGALDNSFK